MQLTLNGRNAKIGRVNPAELMTEGNQLLAAVLEPAGFQPNPIESGVGSGGAFATTCWTRGDQAIELSFRTSLGMIVYRWGAEAYGHKHVVAALGVTTSYPGFGRDPLDGFRHLASDLAGPLAGVVATDTSGTLAQVRGWEAVTPLP